MNFRDAVWLLLGGFLDPFFVMSVAIVYAAMAWGYDPLTVGRKRR